MEKTQAHEIEIIVGTDGKIQTKVIGVAGPSCSSLSAWLDELGEVLEDSKTPDFYKPAAATIHQQAKR